MNNLHPPKEPLLEFAAKVLNQVFQVRKRLARIAGTDSAERSLEALEDLFADQFPMQSLSSESVSVVMHDPTGEKYSDTRCDVQASLAGEAHANLRIVETMKPIISIRTNMPDGLATSMIIQPGIVVVRGSDAQPNASI